jgi:hypothetical protein
MSITMVTIRLAMSWFCLTRQTQTTPTEYPRQQVYRCDMLEP